MPAALFKPRTVKGTASQATPLGRCLAYTRIELYCVLYKNCNLHSIVSYCTMYTYCTIRPIQDYLSLQECLKSAQHVLDEEVKENQRLEALIWQQKTTLGLNKLAKLKSSPSSRTGLKGS